MTEENELHECDGGCGNLFHPSELEDGFCVVCVSDLEEREHDRREAESDPFEPRSAF